MANMITVIASIYLAHLGAWTALLCILMGFALGTVSGFVATRLYVPSFISTLAVESVCFSIAQWLRATAR